MIEPIPNKPSDEWLERQSLRLATARLFKPLCFLRDVVLLATHLQESAPKLAYQVAEELDARLRDRKTFLGMSDQTRSFLQDTTERGGLNIPGNAGPEILEL